MNRGALQMGSLLHAPLKAIGNAGIGVLTAVTMKNIVFSGVTPCKSIELYRHFGGTCLVQGRRLSQRSNRSSSLKVKAIRVRGLFRPLEKFVDPSVLTVGVLCFEAGFSPSEECEISVFIRPGYQPSAKPPPWKARFFRWRPYETSIKCQSTGHHIPEYIPSS
jgi:hypothetical protein